MKKRIFTTIVVAVVLLISVFSLCACGGGVTGEVEIKSFKAEEAIESFYVCEYQEKEGGTKDWDRIPSPFEISKLSTGTDMGRYWGWAFELNVANLNGYEFAVMQLSITAAQDMDGKLEIWYLSEDKKYSKVCVKDYAFSLKANEKKTFSIAFEENFVVLKNLEGEIDLHFSSGKQENSEADVAWSQNKFSISDFELGVNENK